MNMSQKAAILQTISSAPTLATFGSAVGTYLDGYGVDNDRKQQCDEMTTSSLAKCDTINEGDFEFHTIQLYARPISEIGTHNTENTENDEKTDKHINNAKKASNGYHHGLLILSYGTPEPSQYLLDRVEGVRFVKVNIVEEELKSGHLVLIKEYNKVNIKYQSVRKFIQTESVKLYNAAKNNCLDFVYRFIDEFIQQNEWNDNFAFWEFIRKHFNAKDIADGKFNEQQNHYEQELLRKKILLAQKIKTISDHQRRRKWKKGDKILIKSTNCQAKQSWYLGRILSVDVNIEIDDENKVVVEYEKSGKLFRSEQISVLHKTIKPYIEIPMAFLDPITNKIMKAPVQMLRSGVIYDKLTVQYIQTSGMLLDPITGVLISIGNRKPAVERQQVLQSRIQRFVEDHNIGDELMNSFEDLKNQDLWTKVLKKLHDKYDIKQQQKLIYQKCVPLFYPEKHLYCEKQNNKSKISLLKKHVKLICSKSDDKKDDEKDDEKVSYESDRMDQDLLRWNSDHMFINHTSIPMITCMGPSRIGKSFLLSEILRTQKNWERMHNIFETSETSDIATTKGSWISLYGEIDNKPDSPDCKTHDEIALIDQWPEDDVSMWSTKDIISWFNSLNPKFEEVYKTLIQYIQSEKINGRILCKYSLDEIIKLISAGGLEKTQIDKLSNILYKRVQNTMDEIESNKINQMYFVDMEGLSHGVTQFTHKIFHGSYAISNVFVWFDIQVNSDSFKTLMKELKESMQIVAKSKRKPAFIYLLRNADMNKFDFGDVPENEIDSLDYYIKNSDTFKEFREMNMFSSIHGYQLQSPNGLVKKQWSRGARGNKVNKKQKIQYEYETLCELISTIKSISHKTKRFANNSYVLNNQINNINKYSSLSPEKRLALCNSKLKWFVLSDKSDDIKKQKERELQIKNAMIIFEQNVSRVEVSFKIGYDALKQQLAGRNLTISQEFSKQLMNNANEIVLEIKKRETNASSADNWKNTSIGAGVGGTVVGAIAMIAASGGVAIGIGCVFGVATLLSYVRSKMVEPEKLEQIEETDLETLHYI